MAEHFRELDIFPCSYTLCQSQAEFDDWCAAQDWQDAGPYLVDNSPATTHRNARHFAVCVNLDHDVTLLQKIGLLIHEADHVTRHILHSVGEVEPGLETSAYLQQRVAQDLIYWAGLAE